jgi:anti-sigma regulatory factor (Ser/Thr protein kinase)
VHHDASTTALQDARLVATELVANSVRHASPLPNASILVRWHHDEGALAFSVSDGGGADEPRLVDADTEAEQGRGLAIVDTLAVSWWVERTRRVHTVHVRVPLA